MNLMGFLVKRRNILLAAMTALAVLCALMIPKLNVILEITFFLPDDSPMKIGLNQLEEDFPGMRGQMSMLSVMLEDVEDKEAEEKTLTELTGGLVCMSVKDSGNYTLYQFLLTKDCDYQARRKDITQHYGGNAVVEVDLDKNMPADIIPMLISGALLVFLVLFVMCSSFVEVLLFLFTTLLAVAINMGSNILLGSVSYLTNTMVAVLQMILSMDYSIIIMNRYRQEKLHFPGNNPKAMEVALGRAAPSVLSSAVTTIASLLMLMFMHLKLGVDMGVVLSKGVLCSFICNFTVLPALILIFDKAIVKTEKKIPRIPFKKLARFEVRYRIVLSVLFVGIFVAAFLLQKRTEISFSAIWETEIAKHFPPQNPMVLMYDTEEEDAIPGILDTLQRDPMVESCMSYPGFTKKSYTAAEMAGQFAQMSPLITEELVRIVYYSYTHPERNERLSINEIQDLAEDLSREGLIPDGFDVKALAAKFTVPAPAPVRSAPKVEMQPETPSVGTAVADTSYIAEAKVDSSLPPHSVADTVLVAGRTDTIAVEDKPDRHDELVSAGIPRITYEMATEQLTAKEMSARYGIERSYLNTIFRMAGRTRKPATMSPHEMATFVNNKLLNDKRYSGFVNAEQTALFKD
ncbi:MAG: MMPL family transporter, partial [Bacteroidales bacterium]|nr:MMPL family transporter [Bacteroidales bacterium]